MIDEQWIDDYRRKLIAQGAVFMFEKRSEEDQIALKGLTGMVIATQGLGLYRESRGYTAYFNSQYESWSREQWIEHLKQRDERLRYLNHTGYHYHSDDYNEYIVAVKFIVVK